MSSRVDTNEFSDSIRETITRLRQPVSELEELLALLCAPLASNSLLPDSLRKYNTSPTIPITESSHTRWISAIQVVILQHVVPSWERALVQEKKSALLDQYFCPIPITEISEIAADFSIFAYSNLLSFPSSFALRLLGLLVDAYPIDRLFEHIFLSSRKSVFLTAEWEQLVQAVGSIPSKTANFIAQLDGASDPPNILQSRAFTQHLCLRFEFIVKKASEVPNSDRLISPISHLLLKMIQTGAFPQGNTDVAGVSFFACCGNTVRKRLKTYDLPRYSSVWSALFSTLPSSAMQTFLSSLVSSLPTLPVPLSPDPSARRQVKNNARLLMGLLGRLDEQSETWTSVIGVLLGRTWNEHIARVLVCWASGASGHSGPVDESAIRKLILLTLDIWSTVDHSRNLLVTRHQYMTCILMTSLSYIEPKSPFLLDLAVSDKFLPAVTNYIGNLDPTIRRIGMAVAEYVAALSGRNLNFGGWEGDAQGRKWVREVRLLVREKDSIVPDLPSDSDDEAQGEEDATMKHEIEFQPDTPPPSVKLSTKETQNRKPRPLPQTYDSDDSLTGYDSSSSSSRAPSPSPSELEEIEKDPTLRVGGGLNKKKVTRPIYLADLGDLLRPTKKGEQDEYEKLQMGLLHAEELIRRKKDYGTELEENAANMTLILVGLQDNYDLDGFDEKRQNALTALVAGCPLISAPCIIEQFFHNQYSTSQRFAMLNALGLGARELAGLPVAPTPVSQSNKSNFPSKMLPPALHQRYIAAEPQSNTPVALLASGISELALERGREEAEGKVPQIIREKQLRVRNPAPSIVDITASKGLGPVMAQPASRTAYKDVAAEYFVVPLIERFWLHLRDEQAREARSGHFAPSAYRGAGTGMILDALVLRQFISTLAVLLHAARHSPAFLAVLAPEALEVAVTLGTRPVSVATNDEEGRASKEQKDMSVLASTLELALVILDACVDLDGGRTLSLDKTSLTFAVRDWAGEIFRQLEDSGGVQLNSGSGDAVNRVRRAGAGVLLQIEEVTDRWKRSMISL